MKLDDKLFVYCELCDCVAYKPQCCGILTCTGRGCDDPMCDILYKLSEEAIINHMHPPIETLPHIKDDLWS